VNLRPAPTASPAPRPAGPPRRPAPRALLLALAASLALGGFGAPARAQQVRLPALGESASADLSVADEKRIGEQILREARRDPDFLDDPTLLAYVQSLWQPLLAAARAGGHIDAELERQFAWELFLVRDRTVNAFAWPGGYVGVHLGLVALTTNADQLASVLAHEMAHVSQRHIARSIGNAQRASLLTIAGFLLGVLAASRSNSDGANAAIVGGQAAGAQAQLNFSRDMEREADRVGALILNDARFAPGGMAQMFEKLDLAQRINDSGGFPYLRSHPLTTERISEARNRLLLTTAAAPQPTLMHALMQLRARVLMDPDPQALARLAGGGSSSPLAVDRVAALYGGALAQLRLGQPARAESMLAEAQAAVAALPLREADAERALALERAQARAARGDVPGALALLDELGRAGIDRPLLLAQARAALAWGRSDAAAAAPALRQATEALQTWVAERPQDAQAWELLAGTSEAIGQKLRSMRAAAEARAVLGDLAGAVDRLRAAQSASRSAGAPQDFIEASVIDARLRQLQRERRELALEMQRQRGGGRDDGRGAPQPQPQPQ
jgi:predicted Zn-dependent protease